MLLLDKHNLFKCVKSNKSWGNSFKFVLDKFN
jgi:hypothetical protein